MSYSVSLIDGTTFTGLAVNGTCFVSKQPVSAEQFACGTKYVTIQGVGEDAQKESPYGTGKIEGLEFGGVFTVEGEYYFFFTRLSEQELAAMKNRADIEYIAMRTGVEL